MSTNLTSFSIANIDVDIVRKDIKNMHLAVYPPHGRVRLAAPLKTDFEVLRLFAISKLPWLKRNIKSFESQARETVRDYVSGESHYFKGKRYLLDVTFHSGYNKVSIDGGKLLLLTKEAASKESKANTFKDWYRKQLKAQIPDLITKWESIIGVKASDWGVRQMKTKWGSCNVDSKKIWLNLELAKKPSICLEYIIAHELVHLLERNHTDKFIAHMDDFMPKWRLYRDELNSLPIVHNDWGY